MSAGERSQALDSIFRPNIVAVIGASRRRGTVGSEVFHNLITSGFVGTVYPVNPCASSIQTVRAYPRVLDIPESVDLAVIAVPEPAVFEVLRDCVAKGVRAAVVLTAGFAETGARGKAKQDELVALVRAGNLRMVGPNCLGVLNADPKWGLNASFSPVWPPSGAIAMASQSGAVALTLLDWARDLGLGVSQFISMGNKADVSGNDLLEYWEDDPTSRVLVLYLESLGNSARFMQVAERVAQKKPILVVKSGRTAAGARAAASHTGALAGMDIVADALFAQAGVQRLDTMEELFDLAALLSHQPLPEGKRLGIVTNAGGPGIMAADAAEGSGLALAALSAETVVGMRAFLPAAASIQNPVDMLAAAPKSSYERAIQLMLSDPEVDALLVMFVPPLVTQATDIADGILAAAGGTKKPVLVCLLGAEGVAQATRQLRAGGLPVYPFPEAAVRALARARDYASWKARPQSDPARDAVGPLSPPSNEVRAAIEVSSGWLGGELTFELLSTYGIRRPRQELARSKEEAALIAARIGFPVAVKLASRQVLHKTEVDGVHLHLETPGQVENAVNKILLGVERIGKADALDGFLVQEMVSGGVEMFLGVTEAPPFGSLLAMGAGGVNIEVFRDVAFRVHPIRRADATDMLEQLKSRVLLRGFRGAPQMDESALLEAVLRLDCMLADFPRIAELDINPLVVLPAGRGVVALDARLRMTPPTRT